MFGRRGFGLGELTVSSQDVVADIHLVGLGDVFGTVRDSDGTLLEHALVQARPTGLAEGARVTLTDTDGRFAFPSMPVGDVEVTATDVTGALEATKVVQVQEVGALVEVSIELERGIRLKGQVSLPDGSPGASAEIRVLQGTTVVAESVALADGSFVVPRSLPAEAYRVEAVDEDAWEDLSDPR